MGPVILNPNRPSRHEINARSRLLTWTSRGTGLSNRKTRRSCGVWLEQSVPSPNLSSGSDLAHHGADLAWNLNKILEHQGNINQNYLCEKKIKCEIEY